MKIPTELWIKIKTPELSYCTWILKFELFSGFVGRYCVPFIHVIQSGSQIKPIQSTISNHPKPLGPKSIQTKPFQLQFMLPLDNQISKKKKSIVTGKQSHHFVNMPRPTTILEKWGGLETNGGGPSPSAYERERRDGSCFGAMPMSIGAPEEIKKEANFVAHNISRWALMWGRPCLLHSWFLPEL